jgi:hypothetical protein
LCGVSSGIIYTFPKLHFKIEEKVRKSIVFLSAACFAGSTAAATMEDVAGYWDAQYDARLSVQSLGADRGTASLSCLFEARDAASGSLACTDSGTGKRFSGSTALISKGNKLSWFLDGASLDGMEESLQAWMLAYAAAAGIAVDGNSVAFSKVQVQYGLIGISSKKGPIRLGKTFIALHGYVEADANGRPVKKKFSYAIRVNFLPR